MYKYICIYTYLTIYMYIYMCTGAPLGRELSKAPMLSLRQMQSQNLSKSIEGLSEKDAQKILGNGKTVWIPVDVLLLMTVKSQC